MLREVLRAVESADGPITLNELSRQLSIDPGVLDGMLAHWLRRGKLMIDAETGAACAGSSAPVACSCGSGSPGAPCPFMARMPHTFLVPRPAIPDNGSEQ